MWYLGSAFASCSTLLHSFFSASTWIQSFFTTLLSGWSCRMFGRGRLSIIGSKSKMSSVIQSSWEVLPTWRNKAPWLDWLAGSKLPRSKLPANFRPENRCQDRLTKLFPPQIEILSPNVGIFVVLQICLLQKWKNHLVFLSEKLKVMEHRIKIGEGKLLLWGSRPNIERVLKKVSMWIWCFEFKEIQRRK